ncbi:MAG: NAD(P)/FAD-dependent oxidoreductase [Micromonosporaceae bacterium]
MTERADAVVVGARCAGVATGIALARAGRRVIAYDRATFPSDTLSTHLLFAGGVAELAELGALERVEAIGAPRLPVALMAGAGLTVTARYTPVHDIDYGLCVRRTGLDAALAETARQAGVEIREATRVTHVIWDGDRAAGVRAEDRKGRQYEIRAPLVVGADGRRSTIARQVGAATRRQRRNGRACLFAYWRDGEPGWRSIAAQWRNGDELGTAFPCDGGLVLVLLMPPVSRAADRPDIEQEYDRTLARLPALHERLIRSTRVTRCRSTADTPSYFRRSAGPGWALPGDAGHFKDPVTAQGIRDALRFGRLLGELAAPALDDPVALDRALRDWEHRRDRECLEAYQWTNRLARAESMSPLEVELYRAGAASPELARQFLDVFARSRRPGEVFTVRRALSLARQAYAREPGRWWATSRAVARELARETADRLERGRASFLL